MMALMDKLTDKLNWHEKIYDDAIVARWREEAMEQSEDNLFWQIAADKRYDTDEEESEYEDEDEEEKEDRLERDIIRSDLLPRPGTRILSEDCFDYVGYDGLPWREVRKKD
jgi:hypothetical protein